MNSPHLSSVFAISPSILKALLVAFKHSNPETLVARLVVELQWQQSFAEEVVGALDILADENLK